MSERDTRRLAREYFQLAYECQMRGDYHEAIAYYTRSIESFPTAEAYTFRGWTYSFLGDLDRAIDECKLAINLDPSLGNPYNDIGAYLIEQDKWDEAIPWFQKAIHAARYEARCYPHLNLGRVYERKQEWKRAKECYARAYFLNPHYTEARVALQRLQARFN
ncbi:MAG TPA: tetratricopeptide repeat protein [Terriglobales bacterium]|nr:tetratricopeptide repeat protein [Terriglobales bacterium]